MELPLTNRQTGQSGGKEMISHNMSSVQMTGGNPAGAGV